MKSLARLSDRSTWCYPVRNHLRRWTCWLGAHWIKSPFKRFSAISK